MASTKAKKRTTPTSKQKSASKRASSKAVQKPIYGHLPRFERMVDQSGTGATNADFNPGEWIDALLMDAYKANASDIHIEPLSSGARVRVRVDGNLHDAALISKPQSTRLIRHLKTHADLDPVTAFVPQDAQTHYELDGQKLDMRLACTPCFAGEKLVLRLFDPNRIVHRLEELGLQEEDKDHIYQWLSEISGMCLVTGPIGSGKTTTLYSILHELKFQDKAILTIEDPVEYQIEGVTQLQVDNRHGLTFSEGLKSMLRLDPDYLLVGEIRDRESGRTAVDASATGKALLSTMHSRDTAGVVTALRNWEVTDHEIATSLELVIAQRLVRLVCKHCWQWAPPDPVDANWLRSHQKQVPNKTVKPVGCEECQGTGYRGRTGVFEIWRYTEADYDLILSHAHEHEIRRHLRHRDVASLLNKGLRLVDQKVTTLSEIRLMGSHETLPTPSVR